MKTACLLFVLFVSTYISAQQVEFKIIENSVVCRNDTLQFVFRITNSDSVPYAIYNIKEPDIQSCDFEEYSKQNHDKIMPRLMMNIVNAKGKLCDIQVSKMGGPYSSSTYISGQYTVIMPDSSFEVLNKTPLWDLVLNKGKYRFKIFYYPNENYFKNDFSQEKNKNQKLSDCELFSFYTESNTVQFRYTPPNSRNH